MVKRKRNSDAADRRDPSSRGIHTDALRFEKAKSGRATCGSCYKVIAKNALRWGLKYAGNPLPEETVIPLYGTQPMYMWFHESCGFSLSRHSLLRSRHPEWHAAQTCHLCGEKEDGHGDIRLRCGAKVRGKKVMFHNFHVSCALRCFDGSEHGRPASLEWDKIDKSEVDVDQEEEKTLEQLFMHES